MQRVTHNIFVKNLNLLKTSKKTLYNLNKVSKEYLKINNNANVSLATSVVKNQTSIFNRTYSNSIPPPNSSVDNITFEKVCEETLESLTDYIEELVESSSHLSSADVSYSSGVLTVNFGNPYGTYVINRQSPNHQIWLSSPTSGPKRYDFVPEGNFWVYKHDNVTLHQLLQQELKDILKKDIDFSQCAYSLL